MESRDVTKLTAAMRLAEQTEAFDHTESKVIQSLRSKFNLIKKINLQEPTLSNVRPAFVEHCV